ncbi:hypothetical protein L2E82_44801 [Cichorium intybus]|uniref:Uncharacterized protein n=1 Tax=Cichorium intybus TaxID=13427 RepID=A0ACB8ZVN2_CICIN|nr:hypothetical protein L2E82_44801 [Cichorium intybus]
MIKLEKQRMEFTKEVEFQRLNMFMETQLELDKMKKKKPSTTRSSPVLTTEWYTGVLARIRINAVRIGLAGGTSYEDLLASAIASVESEASVGNVVYLLPSFYNHDRAKGGDVGWHIYDERSLLALQGPLAGSTLQYLTKED